VRVFAFSVQSYGAGVETHDLEGVPVRVYSPAKTVADCAKFRNKVGKDVAIEAHGGSWRQARHADADLHAAVVAPVSRFRT
jgi:hypothetical protein